MQSIGVWAPNARKVALNISNRTIDMPAGPDGWWLVTDPAIRHGEDYTFILDGQSSLPDPRSPWQPRGIFGPSRFYDHSLFRWNDERWQQGPLSSAVIYELHIGTFSPEGTFDGTGKYLGHLVDLGITHVEIMPVNTFPGARGWGYDGVYLYAPQETYGGPDGLKTLVNACHEHGLSVILDVVYNHLGPSGNYLDRFGPYFTSDYVTPWGKAVNMDGGWSHEVRRFLCDNALMWLRDYHMDGLRLDAVHAILDSSAVHFLEQLSREVKELEAREGRHFYLIAENDRNETRPVLPGEAGGYGIDAQWNEDFHHALHTVLTGERDGYYADFGTLADLAKVMSSGYANDGRFSVFRNRFHGRSAQGLNGHHFVAYMQNHDQIGNRATGDRIHHLTGLKKAQIGSALTFTSPFVPLVFQGEEWGASAPFLYFSDHEDPALAKAVREGRRAEFAGFGWDPSEIPDPQDRETYRKSCLDWKELEKSGHRELHEWYKRMIYLSKRCCDLTLGRMDHIVCSFDEDRRWFVMKNGSITVACNFHDTAWEIPYAEASEDCMITASDNGIRMEADSVILPGKSVAIFSR